MSVYVSADTNVAPKAQIHFEPKKGNTMRGTFDQHLCLSDLLDQDLTSYEYFHSLPREIQLKIIGEDIGSFKEMQDFVAGLR